MSDHIEQRAKAWQDKINAKLDELRVYSLNAIPAEVDELLQRMTEHGFEYTEVAQYGLPTQIRITRYNP